jgi:hypothetical protein
VKHITICGERGKFCGLPANNGIWNWGDEIVVGFNRGIYKETSKPPSMDRERPQETLLARSRDGGESWHLEQPVNFGPGFDAQGRPEAEDAVPLPAEVDFGNPDLAMRCSGGLFRVSYDRGGTWRGPYAFPSFGLEGKMSARTDYSIRSSSECLFFLSSRAPGIRAKLQDRAFCARTSDGGRTFSFLSWIDTEAHGPRSVMPSTVRLSETELVTTMRRRKDRHENGELIQENWIDAHYSPDNGASWQYQSKVADTDTPEQWKNGNPPSAVKLPDGRICVTYGYRATPYAIKARISTDRGRDWSPEIILRKDARLWDIGYTRSVVRGDGKIVTIYYFTTIDQPHNFLAATIWHPDEAAD